MMKTIARRRLEAFEREWNYDAGYMHEILDAGGLEALMAVANLDKLSNYRRDVPPEPYFVAKLAAVRAGDCGPCTQLVATMAERAGVDPAALRAVLERNPDALSEDACLAYEFAEATLAHERDGRRAARTRRRCLGNARTDLACVRDRRRRYLSRVEVRTRARPDCLRVDVGARRTRCRVRAA